jgi:hypothetical protein
MEGKEFGVLAPTPGGCIELLNGDVTAGNHAPEQEARLGEVKGFLHASALLTMHLPRAW